MTYGNRISHTRDYNWKEGNINKIPGKHITLHPPLPGGREVGGETEGDEGEMFPPPAIKGGLQGETIPPLTG
jgi:hypothetical protein